jgi:hypothetical protein
MAIDNEGLKSSALPLEKWDGNKRWTRVLGLKRLLPTEGYCKPAAVLGNNVRL